MAETVASTLPEDARHESRAEEDRNHGQSVPACTEAIRPRQPLEVERCGPTPRHAPCPYRGGSERREHPNLADTSCAAVAFADEALDFDGCGDGPDTQEGAEVPWPLARHESEKRQACRDRASGKQRDAGALLTPAGHESQERQDEQREAEMAERRCAASRVELCVAKVLPPPR